MSQPSHASTYYLFRHALLRDAAYELQLPGERAALHLHALRVLRELYDDPANPAAVLPWAEDILPHARAARDAEGVDRKALRQGELRLTYFAGCHASFRFENDKALELLALVQDAPEATITSRVGAALRRGGIYYWLARHADAIACREAALRLAREAGNVQLEAMALAHLATSLHASDRADEVEGLYRRVVEIERGQNLSRQLPATLSNLGLELMRQGRHDEADECLAESIELLRANGDRENEAIITCNLGELRIHQGRVDEGDKLLHHALQLSREIGARRAEGATLGQLAGLALKRDDLPRADELLRQALAINRDVGNLLYQAVNLVTRARLRVRQARKAEAIEDYLAAASIQARAGWANQARESEQSARALQG